MLRSGLVRNLGNITAARLFNHAYAGTKLLIEDYVTQVVLAVEELTIYPTTSSSSIGPTSQAKLDVLHDTRQAFGRSALVLQGGGLFGLCHVGVVKALHLRGVLPRIIVGTATGAMVAALVGVIPEDALLHKLSGEVIACSTPAADDCAAMDQTTAGPVAAVVARLRLFYQETFPSCMRTFETFVRRNIGDLTFLEAYLKTKKVLNITVSTADGGGVPNLLNYLTAPNVVSISEHDCKSMYINTRKSLYGRLRLPLIRRILDHHSL